MHKNIGVKLCNMLKRKNRKKIFALNIDFFNPTRLTKKTLTNPPIYGIVYGRMEEERSFFYAQKQPPTAVFIAMRKDCK